MDDLPIAKGRGSRNGPANRFERIHVEPQYEDFEHDGEEVSLRGHVQTEYFDDDSKSIISENQSPDVPFRYSLNPYRGCQHGCSYCYARPTHEYLGYDAGIDFESKIVVKRTAAELFRRWLARANYKPEWVVMSGVTDCYQPVERKLEITRKCIQVALDARQPLGVITKNAMVTRDIDLLSEMAGRHLASVAVSLTTLDASLARDLEPRTSTPAARLRAIEELSQAGIHVTVMISPVIPGLTNHELPSILQAAADAGAKSASYIMLRLPSSVRPVFFDWLHEKYPSKAEMVESSIRGTRGGELTEAEFGKRMRGGGPIAQSIKQMFQVFCQKYELNNRELPSLETSHFRRPTLPGQQLDLF